MNKTFWEVIQRIKNHKHFTFDDILYIYNGNKDLALRWTQDALCSGRIEKQTTGYKYNQ